MRTNIIGRKEELRKLEDIYNSNQSEFVVVYGRRRVGKTYLVRECFEGRTSFHLTGLANSTTREQLLNFVITYNRHQPDNLQKPKNWLEAFDMLATLIERSETKRKLIFIDEMPWLDTPRSGFTRALEHFWNGWASARKDVVLIVCGSATSWIMDKIINNHGGLHNRITQQIKLSPFTLCECADYFEHRKMEYSRQMTAECYMAMGGIPYYMSLMRKGLSGAQNINALFFGKNAPLANEFDNLYASLFRNSGDYVKIVEALSKKMKGLSRSEIIAASKLSSNGELSKMLRDLENCGFIRSYVAFGKKERDKLYQLTDFYTLFYFRFAKENRNADEHLWTNLAGTPAYNTWAGYSFEMLCLCHLPQLKKAMGIMGILAKVSSWRSTNVEPGAQIDLIIDRNDKIVNLCEMKYGTDTYTISKTYEENLRHKRSAFIAETKTRKAVHLTMVTSYGIRRNEYSNGIQWDLTLNDLFD